MSALAQRTIVVRLPNPLRLLLPASRAPERPAVLSTAETAECTCPEFCERDHDNE